MEKLNISIIQTTNTNYCIGIGKRRYWGLEKDEIDKIRASWKLVRFTLIKQAEEMERRLIDHVLTFCQNTPYKWVHFNSKGITLQSDKPVYHNPSEVYTTSLLFDSIIAGKSKKAIQLGFENDSVLYTMEKYRSQNQGMIGMASKDTHRTQQAVRFSLHSIVEDRGGTFLLVNSKNHGIYDVQTKQQIAKNRNQIIAFNYQKGFLSTSERVPGINFEYDNSDLVAMHEFIAVLQNSAANKSRYFDAGIQTMLKDLRVGKIRWPEYNKFVKIAKSALKG